MSALTKETRNMILRVVEFQEKANEYLEAIYNDPNILQQRILNEDIFAARSDVNFTFKEWKS